MTSVVIADAGPLIGLARLQRLHLLRAVFGEVSITTTIRDELLPTADHADKAAIQAAMDAGWLKTQEVKPARGRPLYSGVDAGERSAIYLALQFEDVLLVMDDRAGRAEAIAHKLPVVATAAVIGMAKLKGLIPLARPLLFELRASGYYLSETVIRAVLEDVGE